MKRGKTEDGGRKGKRKAGRQNSFYRLYRQDGAEGNSYRFEGKDQGDGCKVHHTSDMRLRRLVFKEKSQFFVIGHARKLTCACMQETVQPQLLWSNCRSNHQRAPEKAELSTR